MDVLQSIERQAPGRTFAEQTYEEIKTDLITGAFDPAPRY